MNIYAWVLLCAFAVAALADWAAVARRRPDLESVAKPAVLVILILLAWLLRADSVDYGNQLLIGLVLCLIGDVLLLGRSDRHFLAGLIAFLLAHVAYIAAFRRIPGEGPIWWGVIAVAVLGVVVILTKVLPIVRASGRDGIPLVVYALVVGGMAALAWATGLPVVGIGATLFLASDALIAYDRFVRPLAWGQVVVHITYHLGQLLIVLGMLRT
ncbi:MAG: lysoplasmalogenase [Actinomycetales bacterium]|jgi:uncharacterized membrane protein YhhN|uniref:Lysoplasmalogenase n=1 Tax=Candidatus Phosphoribacter hodrii TaxID=2953743 RepID=A0A935CD83_9MICO|nr:lysoplasmalogenase [Candidatus Phosphoribacter hodrii]